MEIDGATPEENLILELEVDFDASKPCRGARGPHGEQMEPDDDGDLEIVAIRIIPDAELLAVLTEEVQQYLATPHN